MENKINLEKLIQAIMIVESHGNVDAVGDNGKAIGCLQIHSILIEDVNQIYDKHYVWPDDAKDKNKSIAIAQYYLTHYGKLYEMREKKLVTYANLAKIWNGGPLGYLKKATEGYAQRVLFELDRLEK